MDFLKYKNAVIASLFVGFLLILSGCGEGKSTDDYVKDAQSSLANDENNTAIIAFKNAIRLEPKNVVARVELGKLYLKIGDVLNADKEIQKAEELGLDLNVIAPLMAEVAIIQTNYSEVIVYAEKVKPLLEEAAGDRVRFYHLAALFYEGSLSDNFFEVNQLQQSKNPVLSSLGNMFNFMQKEDFNAALSVFETIQQDKNLPLEALIIAAQLYTLEGAHDKASAVYQRYLVTRVKDHKAKVLIAESLIEEGRFDEAANYIDQVLALSKNHAFANQLKAVVFFNKKEFDKAQEFSFNSINNGLASSTNKLILAISHFQLKNYEQSLSYFNGIIDVVPPEHPLRQLYLMLQFQLGNIDEVASEIMSDTEIDELDANLLVAASYELIKSSKIQSGKALLSQLEGTEFDPASRGTIGLMKLAVDDESAVDDLYAALKNQPNNEQLKVALALSYFKNQKSEQAIKLALDWIKSDPTLPSGYNLAGYFYLQTDQLDKAKEVYQKALEFIPNNKPSLLFESYEEERAGNIDSAEQTILALIAAHPDYIVAYSRLYQIYKLQEREEEFLSFLAKANQNKADAKLVLLMAEIKLEMGEYGEVIELLSNEKMQADNNIIKIKILSRAYEGQSDIEKSISTYEELLELSTNSATPLKLLELYEKSGLFDKALVLINKGLKDFPSNPSLLYLKSLFEVYAGNVQAAQVTLDRLRQQESKSVYLQNIQGLIYLKSKRFEKAKAALVPVYEEKPSNKTAMSVYIVYENLNEKQNNIDFLTKHIERYPSAQSIRILLAQLLADTSPETTIEHYNYILKTQPDNWPILNNIAWSYAQVGKLNLAEQSIRKALELNKNSQNLFDTLTYVIKMQNRPDILISEVEELDSSNLPSSDVKLRYAWALIQQGEKERAKRILEQLRGLSNKQNEFKAELNSVL